MRFSTLAAACVLLAAAPPVAAQITVAGIRDLAFGSVVPGVATHVLPNDAVKGGQFQFITAIGNTVRIRFTLPSSLNGPSGATMAISFANNDGIAVGTQAGSVPERFNPKATEMFNGVTSTITNVFLGGTVTPSATQAFGAYTNTITITVTVM